MKRRGGSVLAHDPGVRVADFFHGMRRKARELRVPARCARIVAGHALAQLHQSVLDVTGVLVVVQIFGDLLV